MTDFRDAFAQGQAAFRDAERARSEIDALLFQFTEQVNEASGGLLLVRREKRPGPDSRTGIFLTADGLQRRTLGSTYDALTVGRSDGVETDRVELCRFDLAETSYPVTLQYARTEERCHDREALEEGLKRMLANPTTGGLLARLLDRPRAA